MDAIVDTSSDYFEYALDNCDNPHASTPTCSALSQLLTDHTPKVTPLAAALEE